MVPLFLEAPIYTYIHAHKSGGFSSLCSITGEMFHSFGRFTFKMWMPDDREKMQHETAKNRGSTRLAKMVQMASHIHLRKCQ